MTAGMWAPGTGDAGAVPRAGAQPPWGGEPLARQGFALVPQLLDGSACDALAQRLSHAQGGRAGTRALLSQPWCRDLARRLPGHAALAALLPPGHVAVQCTYFEKSAAHNWLVPVHQDLGIPVAERVAHPPLRGWSEKEGVLHVLAPAELLQQLVAVRLHIDDCAVDDGPLRVVPGSHLHGPLDEQAAAALRQAAGEVVCAVPRGGALVMRPLLLHASSKASGTSLRRVLHFLLGPRELPFGLRWPAWA